MTLLDAVNSVKIKKFEPSVYQQAIFDFVKNPEGGNGICSAVAGSGKTTTLVEAGRLIGSKEGLFAAFNKSIVEELKLRIPHGMDIATTHSIGFSAIKAKLGYKVRVDARKYTSIIKTFTKRWELKEDLTAGEYRKKIKQLCDLYRQNYCESPDDLAPKAEKAGILFQHEDLVRACDVVEFASSDERTVDFIDQLFYPLYHNMEFIKTYDWVFIDECQDLNRCQQMFLERLLKKQKNGEGEEITVGRWLAVGDPGQAIYGFAGADTDSYNKLKSMADVELPLSISYRCAQEVIKLAQTIYPAIQASPTAPVGVVNHKGKLSDVKDGDFILCRNTAPLVDVCLKFLEKGHKAQIIGSDIGKDLISMVEGTNEGVIEQMFVTLKEDEKDIMQSLWEKGYTTDEALDSEIMQRFKEKVTILKVITKANRYTHCFELTGKINSIFNDNDKSSGIILSTIHKAKGLEANNVHIICKELMPSPRAKKDWELEQERNLMYVAYTRAKLTLNFVEDYKFIF